MANKANAQTKKTESKNTHSASHSLKEARISIQNTPQDVILNLQRTIGNQAVGRLYRSGLLQAKLKIGSPNDKLVMGSSLRLTVSWDRLHVFNPLPQLAVF